MISRYENTVQVMLKASAGWKQKVYVMADNHFDSIGCNRKLLKAHFEMAKSEGAYIIIVGDWYDAMQGRADPRRDLSELRPEYKRSDYYDYVVESSAEWLEPYLDNLLLISQGNHETKVLKHTGTDLTERLVYHLRSKGSKVQKGGYGGYIKFQFDMHKKTKTLNLKYYHGKGGGSAVVTRGVIDTNRQAVIYPDADYVVNGHNHEQYVLSIPRERITQRGRVYIDSQWHLRTPGYKDGWGDGSGGFDVESGTPKNQGCICIEWDCKGGQEIKGKCYAVLD